jgi:hypothetical protein
MDGRTDGRTHRRKLSSATHTTSTPRGKLSLAKKTGPKTMAHFDWFKLQNDVSILNPHFLTGHTQNENIDIPPINRRTINSIPVSFHHDSSCTSTRTCTCSCLGIFCQCFLEWSNLTFFFMHLVLVLVHPPSFHQRREQRAANQKIMMW